MSQQWYQCGGQVQLQDKFGLYRAYGIQPEKGIKNMKSVYSLLYGFIFIAFFQSIPHQRISTARYESEELNYAVGGLG